MIIENISWGCEWNWKWFDWKKERYFKNSKLTAVKFCDGSENRFEKRQKLEEQATVEFFPFRQKWKLVWFVEFEKFKDWLASTAQFKR